MNVPHHFETLLMAMLATDSCHYVTGIGGPVGLADTVGRNDDVGSLEGGALGIELTLGSSEGS